MKILALCVVLPTVALAGDQVSHTCKFNHGPLQGQTHTQPNREGVLVGTSCSDGLTSSGVAVPDPVAANERMTHTCRFNRGPLQGQTHTLANHEAFPVGSSCSDGLTSSGIAVGDPAPGSERMSHTCKFNRGPLQGQTQSLPNREAVPVGSSCSDGLTSSGVAVRDPS